MMTEQISSIPSFKKVALLVAIHTAFLTTITAYANDQADYTSSDVATTIDDMPTATFATIIAITEPEQADGPVDGIAANTVSPFSGFEQTILKSTQSISVIGQKELKTIGARDINQAVEYTAGINSADPIDKTTEIYIVRGFRSLNAYRDGQKYQANIFNGEQELYGLERIEVIKGPSSVMNGTAPPGGLINAISKKPFFNNAYEVNAELGNFNHHQISTDINQIINDEVAVRMVGVYRDGETYVDLVDDDRIYIAPSLIWQPTDMTTLTLKADYQKDKTAYVGGLPTAGTLYTTANGKIDRSMFTGVNGFDKYDSKRYTLGYDVNHFINPDLEIRHKLQYMETDTDLPWTSLEDLVLGSQTEYTRSVQAREEGSSQLTGSLSAVYQWDTNDHIQNITLLGIDYAKQEHTTARSDAIASNIDLFNPDHSQDSIDSVFTPSIFTSGEQKGEQKGVFLQNQMTVNDKWVGVLGVRHDKTEQELIASLIPGYKQEGDYSATTGRVGLVYLMNNGLAPYASINQSFETNLGKDKNGDLFEPTKATQYEVGVRYQPQGSDTLLTGSIFNINQTDVLVTDPSDTSFQIQMGEVRSQGVELEAKTQLGDNANIIAAYAYTDARTIDSSPITPELKGMRIENVPYNKLSLWGDYTFADFNLPQLRLGAGVRYNSGAHMPDVNSDYPSFTLVDAMASYKVDDNWSLSFNLNNLLDKKYVMCYTNCNYGEPRNMVGKVTYRW